MLWTILSVLAAAIAVAGAVLYWRRNTADGGARLDCRCPKCDRKIRYPASQAGHYAICKGCQHRVHLPYESEDGEPQKKVEDYRVRRKADNAERQ